MNCLRLVLLVVLGMCLMAELCRAKEGFGDWIGSSTMGLPEGPIAGEMNSSKFIQNVGYDGSFSPEARLFMVEQES